MRKEFRYIDDLLKRRPELSPIVPGIKKAFGLMEECYRNDGKILICGNGGSAADSSHIAGELIKSFIKRRTLSDNIKDQLFSLRDKRGEILTESLQGSLPAISLCTDSSVITAISNDIGSELIFAQQILGLGRPEDILLAISTSGNAENVINAAITANAIGMNTIAMTGCTGGTLSKYCDLLIEVPADTTYGIQELHLPVYHTLCIMIEDCFF